MLTEPRNNFKKDFTRVKYSMGPRVPVLLEARGKSFTSFSVWSAKNIFNLLPLSATLEDDESY
jgi:hypothetical protein